jgi:hypothetical protein
LIQPQLCNAEHSESIFYQQFIFDKQDLNMFLRIAHFS